jgi:acetolactate synthase-1/2/3 large subunit
MRVSDRITELLVEFGVKDIFMVTSGATMHLNNAFGRNKYLKVTNMHHE